MTWRPAAARPSELGFDAVEVFPPARTRSTPAAAGLLDDHGLALAAVGTGAGWVKSRLHL